jgi:hypothetical protein
MTPVGFWNISRSTSIAVYRVSGKKPNWLQKLMVYLATGWTWTDAKTYKD